MNGVKGRHVGLTAIAVMGASLVGFAPRTAVAQCTPARVFSSALLGTAKQGFPMVWIDPTGTHGGDLEIGRIWQSDDSAAANNFGGGCPSYSRDPQSPFSGWWAFNMTGTLRAIAGTIGSSACSFNTCPNGSELTVLVEEWGPSGPPGIGEDAFFVLFRIDETPSGLRYYDYSRSLPDPGVNEIVPFLAYPTAEITSSARDGSDIDVSLDLGDVAGHFHGANGTDDLYVDIPIPPEATIQSYDLMVHTGTSDPGRDRSRWATLRKIDYPGFGVTGIFERVPCPATDLDTFLAVGMTFDGDGDPSNESPLDVESALVGRATQLECDPNLSAPGELVKACKRLRPFEWIGSEARSRRPRLRSRAGVVAAPGLGLFGESDSPFENNASRRSPVR